jgi:DNA-binding response OmpR family regulator
MTADEGSAASFADIKACPHCGARGPISSVIKVGAWQLQPTFATFRGEALYLTGAEVAVLYTLGKAAGEVVDPVTLAQKFSVSPDSSNSVRVIISRLRKKLGSDCPIRTVRSAGYRWH